MRPAIRIIFAPLQRHLAVGMQQQRTVWIDPRCKYPAQVLDHELLHMKYPGWSEARVLAEEKRRWKRMTWRQKARLYQLLASASLEGER